MQACAALDEYGKRCQTFVPFNHDFCKKHSGVHSKMASAPDMILMRFDIDQWSANNLSAKGMPLRIGREIQEIIDRHLEEAREAGITPIEFKDGIPQIGTEIFQNGLEFTSFARLLGELKEYGYKVSGAHIEPFKKNGSGGDMWRIVIAYKKDIEQEIDIPDKLILAKLILSAWRHVYIHVNPSLKRGKTVHAVQATGRRNRKKARTFLQFNNGLWAYYYG